MTSAEPLANPELHDVPSAATGAEPRVELPLPPSRRVGEGIDWARIWPFLVLQASCLLVFVVGWSPVAVITCVALYLVRMFGITAFYHRYFSHRTFRVGRGMQFVGALLGAAATQRGPLWWAAHHRQHHRHSDTPQDAHSPIAHGFWWAHIGWIMFGQAMHHDTQVLQRYVPDLSKDRFHVWLTTWHWIPQVVVGLALLAYGGLPYVLWGVFFRTTFGLHATWLVNTATHMCGYKNFRTRDVSRILWWVGLLAWGEGWHNNHHAHPVSMRHGLAWYEFDVNYIQIKTLEKLGLAWDLKVARLPKDAAEIVPQESPDAVDISDAAPVV